MTALKNRAPALLAAFAFVAFLLPSIASAAFTPAQLLDATELAMEKFSTDHAEHLDGFVGYKAWKSGENARVKFYVTHNGENMDFDYLCEMHEEGLDCHAQ